MTTFETMRNLLLPCLLLFTLLTGCGLFGDDPPEVTAFTKSYFYYPEGRVWVFEDTTSSFRETFTCFRTGEGESDFDGELSEPVIQSWNRWRSSNEKLDQVYVGLYPLQDVGVDAITFICFYESLPSSPFMLTRIHRNDAVVTDDPNYSVLSDLSYEFEGMENSYLLNGTTFNNVIGFKNVQPGIGSYFASLKVAQNVGIIEYTRYDSLHFQLIETYDE